MSCRENESQNGSNPGKANRADKRIQWSEESMTGAIKAVVKGSSISGAAREHGVPRTTLQDRVLGKVTHSTKQPISVALSLKRNMCTNLFYL